MQVCCIQIFWLNLLILSRLPTCLWYRLLGDSRRDGFKFRNYLSCQRLTKFRKKRLEDANDDLLAVVASWMNRDQLNTILYLLAEVEILKEHLDRKNIKLDLSNAQRRKLAKAGKKLGRKGLKEYASIVTPGTILAWHRKLVALKYTAKRKIKTDRQKEMEVIKELAIKFAEENPGWGYTRIRGQLEDLGYKVSDTTVGNILRAAGIEPSRSG